MAKPPQKIVRTRVESTDATKDKFLEIAIRFVSSRKSDERDCLKRALALMTFEE